MDIRRLTLEDMPEAALVHRRSFDSQLPSLSGLHTPAEDEAYFLGLFDACACWGAIEEGHLTGILVVRGDWIEQLYILPSQQGRGVGKRLLKIAKEGKDTLFLWTFVQNTRAQAFYERYGFVRRRETDGSENEEREPAFLYQWVRL